MTLAHAAEALNIHKYPAALEQTAHQTEQEISSFCTDEMILSLQKEFDLFGEYANDVLNGLRALRQDPVRLYWAAAVCRYIGEVSCSEARSIAVPASNGTPAGDMLPLLTLIPHIPSSIELYRKRGLPEEDIRRMIGTYKASISAVRQRTGRPGIDKTYYSWLCIYIKAMIFRYDGFNYEIKPMPGGTMILKNRFTRELAALPLRKEIHKSGLILGSGGCEDSDQSFSSILLETTDGFFGNRAQNGIIPRMSAHFSSSDWEVYLRPETNILNVHIPRGTDLSREKVLASFSGAMDYARKAYPDFDVKRVFCCSWLLDPSMGKLVGGNSRIAAFGDLFERFPVSSAGKEVFSFVFTGQYKDYHALPENTRLERALKQLYLQGGFVHAFAGVLKDGLI